MPRLLLFRHAKTEPAAPGQKDHDRTLMQRGREDSATMGKLLAERGDIPDRVLCSTSARTRETWDRAKTALTASSDVRYLRDIYEADGDYIEIVREHGKRADPLMVVGHNPSIHVTALRLADDLGGKDGSLLVSRFPTGAVAVFDFDGKWKHLSPASMTLSAFLLPRGPDAD